jgi:hypothetical protein
MKDIRNIEIQIGDIISYPYQCYSGSAIRLKTGRVIKFNPKSVKVMQLNADGSVFSYTSHSGEEKLVEHNVINPQDRAAVIGDLE